MRSRGRGIARPTFSSPLFGVPREDVGEFAVIRPKLRGIRSNAYRRNIRTNVSQVAPSFQREKVKFHGEDGRLSPGRFVQAFGEMVSTLVSKVLSQLEPSLRSRSVNSTILRQSARSEIYGGAWHGRETKFYWISPSTERRFEYDEWMKPGPPLRSLNSSRNAFAHILKEASVSPLKELGPPSHLPWHLGELTVPWKDDRNVVWRERIAFKNDEGAREVAAVAVAVAEVDDDDDDEKSKIEEV
ncbi:hypothetical protein V1478_016601 [Vespula squamosa]|uniref:Uncharacterized protein n=1 Tax=Vespula squamosa TaxID=30214 RepID=A0ABD2A087_VESSQ